MVPDGKKYFTALSAVDFEHRAMDAVDA